MSTIAKSFLVVCLGLIPFLAAASPNPDCSRQAGTLPDEERPAGTANADIPVEHIILVMEENHSFDNFFGRLSSYTYGAEVDGITDAIFNPDDKGRPVHAFHQASYCVRDTNHSWNGSHLEWNNGANDGFVLQNGGSSGARTMGYYDETDLGYLYAMADRFAVADRYFSSVMGPTFPNRSFFYGASAFGHIKNGYRIPEKYQLIFDVLSKHGVSWKYYYTDISITKTMRKFDREGAKHFEHISKFKKDLESGKLPSVVYLESSYIFGEEHPPFNFQLGQKAVAEQINLLLKSEAWKTSALFLTFDEHGGYHDHVPPPPACVPDDIKPMLDKKDYDAAYDHYGFRVPFVLISPFAKPHYVSHVTYDHTSLLKFIETKFNLPALSKRDANADGMLDLFDFENPRYDAPKPALPEAHWGKCKLK